MKKILLLLADGFEIYEASVYIDVMGWNITDGSKDTKLFTCGITKNLKSSFGIKIEVDFTIDEINPMEFNALAIPGGFENFGFYKDAYSIEFQKLINEFNDLNKIISSICVGALCLGKSGILKNRNATTYRFMGGQRQKQLKDFEAIIGDQTIVTDGNIITSESPATAINVALDLLERLTDKENAEYIKGIMGF